jgi:S1-C subfamily serine protease
MKKIINFIVIFYITLLFITFNFSLAKNSINWENILNYLEKIVKSTNLKNEISPESTEKIFQSVPEYFSLSDYEKTITETIEKVSPAVVSIVVSKDVPIFERYYINPFDDFDLPPEFREFFRFEIPNYRPKGKEKRKIGAGSGFIISSDGLIATNKHVVKDSEAEYTVFLNDGRKFKGKVLSLHPSDDLALIKINANNLPSIKLGDSDKIKLGQTVIAIGNALGEFQNTVSVGVVSGLRRAIVASDERGNVERLENLIQTDAAINPGNSGGPLINLRGEVIGINTAIVSGAQNIGFAIPINRLKKMIQQITKEGKITIPFLGVRYLIITEEVKKQFNLPVDYGAYVYSEDDKKPAVIPNSPAEKAGIKKGDIIIEVDGKKIDNQFSLSQAITNKNVGDIVKIKILREGKEINLNVKLESLPTDFLGQ